MEKIIWSSRFETKVPEMDQQHQNLFRIINQLIEMRNAGDSERDRIFEVLKQMSDYSQYHFRFENNFIHQGTYIGRTRHLDAHDFYLAELKRFIDAFTAGKGGLTTEILDFLKTWWSRHILETDRELAVHIIAQGLTFSGWD